VNQANGMMDMTLTKKSLRLFKSESLMQSTIINVATILGVNIQQEYSSVSSSGEARRFDLVLQFDKKYVIELKNHAITNDDLVECLIRRKYSTTAQAIFGDELRAVIFVGSNVELSASDIKAWGDFTDCQVTAMSFSKFSLWLVRKSRESINTLHDRAIFPSRLYRLYADYGKCSGGTFNKDWLDKELSKGV
jgi:hypothetical protein